MPHPSLRFLPTAVLLGLLLLTGCAPAQTTPGPNPGPGLDPDAPPVVTGDWYRPGVDATWQWQLQGTIDESYDVEVYDIDLFDVPQSVIDGLQAAGRRVLCYFSAGSWEEWREDAGAFAAADLGNTLAGYSDERWLDIRSGNVQRIMQTRLDLAVAKGCDGVEPDNVQGYLEDTGFPLSARDQLAFNRFLANEAHRRGLAVALKNDLEQIPELVAYFDLALDEQCHEFDECDPLQAFVAAGKPVLNAEYAARYRTDPNARQALCQAARAENLRTLVLSEELDGSVRFGCDP